MPSKLDGVSIKKFEQSTMSTMLGYNCLQCGGIFLLTSSPAGSYHNFYKRINTLINDADRVLIKEGSQIVKN